MQRRDSTTASARLRRSVGRSLLLVTATVACDDGLAVRPDRQLPYRFEAATLLGSIPFFEDLDGDGRDEILEVLHPAAPLPGLRTSVLIRTQRHEAAHELGYVGTVARPHTLDVDEDGTRELFVPVLRNDTLHLSVADTEGHELFTFPLATHRPGLGLQGEPPWVPRVLGFHLLDVTGNRRRELVSVISSGSAGDPGGVFVHALPEGRLLDSLTVGAGLDHQTWKELSSGGSVLVLAAHATDNGVAAGGFDDRHSYAIAVDLRLPLRVRWARELGGVGSRVWIRSIDRVGNQEDDLLVVASREGGTRLALLSTAAGVTFLSRESPHLDAPVVTDLDGDGRPEIVAIQGGSSLVAFEPDLNTRARVPLPTPLEQLRGWPDLDGDGRRELSAFDPGQRRHVLINGDLRPKALLPGSGSGPIHELDVVRRGPTRTPLLVTRAGGASRGFELVRNPWYLAWRFGPPLSAAVVPLVFFLLAAAWFRARRRYRLHKRDARALGAGDAASSYEDRSPERPRLRIEAGRSDDGGSPPHRRDADRKPGSPERRRRPA